MIAEGIGRFIPRMGRLFDHHGADMFVDILQTPHKHLALLEKHIPFADKEEDIVRQGIGEDLIRGVYGRRKGRDPLLVRRQVGFIEEIGEEGWEGLTGHEAHGATMVTRLLKVEDWVPAKEGDDVEFAGGGGGY